MLAESYRYIAETPGIRSGRAAVIGTRIGVHDIVGLVLNGATIEAVLRSFPGLSKAQVDECMSYYRGHKGEIEFLISRQMAGPPP
jgi:uncharacterized protein (DUF433 family)